MRDEGFRHVVEEVLTLLCCFFGQLSMDVSEQEVQKL